MRGHTFHRMVLFIPNTELLTFIGTDFACVFPVGNIGDRRLKKRPRICKKDMIVTWLVVDISFKLNNRTCCLYKG